MAVQDLKMAGTECGLFFMCTISSLLIPKIPVYHSSFFTGMFKLKNRLTCLMVAAGYVWRYKPFGASGHHENCHKMTGEERHAQSPSS